MFDKFTTDELQEELEQRRHLEEEANKPKMLERIDPSGVCKLCQGYIDDLAEKGYTDEDDAHYIFEAAMEMCFGRDVWDWINEKMR